MEKEGEMRNEIEQSRIYKSGSSLLLVIISLFILIILGAGLLAIAYGVRHRAIVIKNEAAAMLAAEAGYEKAVFWMSQQPDMLSALQQGAAGTSGTINFPESHCEYQITLHTFVGSRPIYKVISSGHSGMANRMVEVLVIQEIRGWEMDKCRVPSGTTSTYPVYFADGEIIDIPVHINNLEDEPDRRDIYIDGDPRFLQRVTMSESRRTSGGYDKYSGVMNLFEGGIYFDQPESRIANEAAVQSVADRYRDTTLSQYRFQPQATAPGIPRSHAAVQLEFFVIGGIGYVRITNNCTVRGHRENSDRYTWDFKVTPGSDGERYERYDIYAYHLRPVDANGTGEMLIVPLIDTYVSQVFGGYESEPSGQISVDGNVIIDSGEQDLLGILQDVVHGKITIVATGNIWIADSIVVDGLHDADGMPSEDNPNALCLIAQGVIKVVDPGMSDYGYIDGTPIEPEGFEYVPIGRPDNPSAVPGDDDYDDRYLPDPTIVEAMIKVGGGGWGAENVRRGGNTGRKEASGDQDYLIVRGTIAEVVRGVVGLIDRDGYLKRYYFDERLLEGLLPNELGPPKYIAAPAGWHDYRPGG